MKRLALVAGLLLLAGCGDVEKAVQEEPEAVVSATDEEAATEEVKEVQEVEVRQYTDNELDEFQFAMLTASEQASEYLSNMRADIYICGKICDGQPFTDIQLSMDVSRTGVEKSAASLENLVPQIRDVANSGSDNVDANEMNQVADQFEKTAEDMRTFLAKEDWTSWDEPHEMIQTMLDELEAVSWLYKAYSPAMTEDEAGNVEAETNISSAAVDVMYVLDELQTTYDANLSRLREEPYGNDSGVSSVAAIYWEYSDQYITQLRRAADLALQYEMDEALQDEFETIRATADELETAIADYNTLVGPYNEATDYDTLKSNWKKINQTLTRIENLLSVSTYQMQTYQDFMN